MVGLLYPGEHVSDRDLRESVISLANDKPELRAALLPLLRVADPKVQPGDRFEDRLCIWIVEPSSVSGMWKIWPEHLGNQGKGLAKTVFESELLDKRFYRKKTYGSK